MDPQAKSDAFNAWVATTATEMHGLIGDSLKTNVAFSQVSPYIDGDPAKFLNDPKNKELKDAIVNYAIKLPVPDGSQPPPGTRQQFDTDLAKAVSDIGLTRHDAPQTQIQAQAAPTTPVTPPSADPKQDNFMNWLRQSGTLPPGSTSMSPGIAYAVTKSYLGDDPAKTLNDPKNQELRDSIVNYVKPGGNLNQFKSDVQKFVKDTGAIPGGISSNVTPTQDFAVAASGLPTSTAPAPTNLSPALYRAPTVAAPGA